MTARNFARFTQALDQLSEWKAWFDHAGNREIFRDFYAIPDDLWRRRAFKPKYVLIYGRRDEFHGRDALNQKRAQQERPDETHMTFDRLYPEPKAIDLLSVSVQQKGEYHAVAWPASARLGPMLARLRAPIANIDRAIESSVWLSDERRDFLLHRVSYWRDWLRQGKGIFSSETE